MKKDEMENYGLNQSSRYLKKNILKNRDNLYTIKLHISYRNTVSTNQNMSKLMKKIR